MALTEKQRNALADVLEIHQEDVNTHVAAAIGILETVQEESHEAQEELTIPAALAFAQVHALLALGLRVDSLVTILSAAVLPELAPEGIEVAEGIELGPDLEDAE